MIGATGGIGSDVCRRLHEGGACILAAARDKERLEALAKRYTTQTISMDATSVDEVESTFQKVRETYGRIDGVVNCVGSFMLKPIHLTTEEEWDETIDLNLKTSFGVVKAAARHMDAGSVVLMSTVAARVGMSNHEAIAAAKAGVIGLAQAAAASYVSRGLRFNVVAPGLVQTPLTENVTRSQTAREASIQMHPLGRLGKPEDISSAITWLLDPQQSWVTGQIFGVDGGLSTLRPLPHRSQRGG